MAYNMKRNMWHILAVIEKVLFLKSASFSPGAGVGGGGMEKKKPDWLAGHFFVIFRSNLKQSIWVCGVHNWYSVEFPSDHLVLCAGTWTTVHSCFGSWS